MALKPTKIRLGGEKSLRGESVADLDAYLRKKMGRSEPDDRFVHPVCKKCGGDVFSLEATDDAAMRTCVKCITDDSIDSEEAIHFVCDSEEHWAEAETGECVCPCGKCEEFRLSVGFSHVDVGDRNGRVKRMVKWIFVGGMCVRCGVVGLYADWEIDYAPTSRLYKRA